MTGWISLAISLAVYLITIGIVYGTMKVRLFRVENDHVKLSEKIDDLHIEVLTNRVSTAEIAIKNIELRFDKLDEKLDKFILNQVEMSTLLSSISQSVEQIERRRGV